MSQSPEQELVGPVRFYVEDTTITIRPQDGSPSLAPVHAAKSLSPDGRLSSQQQEPQPTGHDSTSSSTSPASGVGEKNEKSISSLGSHGVGAVGKDVYGPVRRFRYPSEHLVTLKSAPFLCFLSVVVCVLFFGWFVNQIILVSMRDQTTYSGGRDTTGYIQAMLGPLTSLSAKFYYSYGHEVIDVLFSFAPCWAAVILRTRQIRAVALFATIWTVFSWLVYSRYVIQGLDKGWTYCQSQPDPSENGFAYDYKWCRISMSNGAWSVMIECVKVAAACWAAVMFIKTKGQEPYCELDKADLEYVARQKAGRVGVNEAAPASPHQRITSLDQCRLDRPGKLILFFCALSTLGFMLQMLGSIEIQKLGNDASTQPGYAASSNILVNGGPYGPAYVPGDGLVGGPVYSAIQGRLVHGLTVNSQTADNNFTRNVVYVSLLLFFAIGLAVAAAYDRARETTANPVSKTFLSTMACWGWFIYAARRIHLNENQQSIHPAIDSQYLIVIGMGITACSEVFRLGALIWKLKSCPPSAPKAAPPAKSQNRIFSPIHRFFSVSMLLVAFAWFIVLLAVQSESGLFEYTPSTTAAESVPGGITNAIAPLAIPSAAASISAAGAAASTSQKSLLPVLKSIITAATTAMATGTGETVAYSSATTAVITGASQAAATAATNAGADATTAAAAATQTATAIKFGLSVVYAQTLASVAGKTAVLQQLKAPLNTTDAAAVSAYQSLVQGVIAQGNSQLFVANNLRQTYINGQQTAEDVLTYPFHNFVISLLVIGFTIGMGIYAELRDDHVGNLVAFTSISVQVFGWWMMCWPAAYSFAFEEGQAHKLFCRRNADGSGDYLFTKNLCQEGEAMGRLMVILFIIYMLNLFAVSLRWFLAPRDLTRMELRKGDVTSVSVEDPNVTIASVVMRDDEKPAHSRVITAFLFLSLGGFVLWACATTRQAQRSYWMPVEDQLYLSIGFDVYSFLAVHFISVSTLVTIFIHAQLASNPSLRHMHYFWRLGEFLASMMNITLSVPLLIFMGRQINDHMTSQDQTAEFVGLLVMVCADLMQMAYCQSLFRRYPLFTTPNEFAIFSKRASGEYLHEKRLDPSQVV